MRTLLRARDRLVRRLARVGASALLVAGDAAAQPTPDMLQSRAEWPTEGWPGFTDFAFLGDALLTLTLAAVLGLVIGYHPRRVRAADTLEKIEAPKVYTMYAVIGVIIGIMVLKYGLVIGFIVFGIGGLIRFRTDLRAPVLTGQVIFVTLIGLSCGLKLPHVAVLATAFGFVLIQLLEARVTYRIEIKALPIERVAAAAAAAAYRQLLEKQGCRIVSERKSPSKGRIALIFYGPPRVTRHDLEELLETRIDPGLKGAVDWEID